MNEPREMLRAWSEINIDKDCSKTSGFHDNGLFWNCTFDNVKGLTLKDCVLRHSKFLTKDVKDAIGLTLTLGDCGSFREVEYSEELFDLFLVMATMTKGNTEKRRKLIYDVIGIDRWRSIMESLAQLETK